MTTITIETSMGPEPESSGKLDMDLIEVRTVLYTSMGPEPESSGKLIPC